MHTLDNPLKPISFPHRYAVGAACGLLVLGYKSYGQLTHCRVLAHFSYIFVGVACSFAEI